MYKSISRGKTAKLLFLLLLLTVNQTSFGSNYTDRESNAFSQRDQSDISLPVRIAPVLVEAPSRHVDLFFARTEESALTNTKQGVRGASLPLAALSVDLFRFPVLKFKANNPETSMYHLELGLDTRDRGQVDTLVRIGSPALFPDMLKERIDFSSAEFVAKDLAHKIKQLLGYAGERKWGYTALNSKVDSIANGVISATFEPGSALVLQKTFASVELSKAPWLRYEYELPEGLPWVVQVNAKIDAGGLSPKLTTVFSEPVIGGGKQTLLVNLLDLLEKAYPAAKDGRLEELVIHFKLAETAGSAIQNMPIGLGKLELYHAQIPTRDNSPAILLIPSEERDFNINLLKVLNKRLGSKSMLFILGGRLVSTKKDLSSEGGGLPKISLSTEYREKIPELFVGERFFLDELSGAELDAVLDQKIFYQKRMLWEYGQSDVIFRDTDDPMRPMLRFSPNTTLGDNIYFKADFLFEDRKLYRLRLTLSGFDVHGKPVIQNYPLSANEPIKIKNIHTLKKMDFSFWKEADEKITFPASFFIRSIQISTFDKSRSYHPKSALAYAALVPAGKPVWRANSERFDILLSGGGNIQMVRSFPVEAKIIGDALVKYKMESTLNENVDYYLRVKATEKGQYLEQIFPMNPLGEIPISNLHLHGFEIIAKNSAPQSFLTRSLILKKFEIEYVNKEVNGKTELPQKKYVDSAEITYLSPHAPLNAPTLSWLSLVYAVKQTQFDQAAMHKLNATLSYAEILRGGRTVVLPKRILAQGSYKLDYANDEGVSVMIDPSFLHIHHNQQARVSAKDDVEKPTYSKLAKIGLLILMGVIVVLGVKFMPVWIPLVDMVLSRGFGFWSLQFVLGNTALYLTFFDANKNALSWGGLLVAFAYGLAVRYKIRPYLVRKWNFFSRRLSAPYFLLFLALLLLCAVMLMLKLNAAAENTIVIGYYLLLMGVFIEFIDFSRGARSGLKLSIEKE